MLAVKRPLLIGVLNLLIVIAGIAALTIGDTVTDLANPKPLKRLIIDEPTMGITFCWRACFST